MKKLLIYLPFLLLAIACKKDPNTPGPKQEPAPEPEQQLPALNMTGLLNYSVTAYNPDTLVEYNCWINIEEVFRETYHYKYPVFNPKNSNQIAFIREETDPDKLGINQELCTFDFSTGKLKVLANNVFYDVQWSTTNWLLYVGTDYNLYKINASGGTPIQLTNTGAYNNFPRWLPNGTQFSFYDWHHGINSKYLIMDENGQTIDTIIGGTRSWLTDSIYSKIEAGTDPNSYTIGHFNRSTNQFTAIDNLQSTINSHGHDIKTLIPFKDKSRLLWNSMYRIGISANFSRTIIKEVIEEAGSTWWFENGVSLSPDEKYIIFQRTDVEKIDECRRYAKTGIYFMNVDGTNERELKFPE